MASHKNFKLYVGSKLYVANSGKFFWHETIEALLIINRDLNRTVGGYFCAIWSRLNEDSTNIGKSIGNPHGMVCPVHQTKFGLMSHYWKRLIKINKESESFLIRHVFCDHKCRSYKHLV